MALVLIWFVVYTFGCFIMEFKFSDKIDEKYDINSYVFFGVVNGIALVYCEIIHKMTIWLGINVFEYVYIFFGLFLIANVFVLISTVKLAKNVWVNQTFAVGRVEGSVHLLLILIYCYIIFFAWTDNYQFFVRFFNKLF